MKQILASVVILCILSCSSYKPQKSGEKKEFRGIWIATVVNIDWPKTANDDVDKQKKDFLGILDFYEELNFNAAVVQIRTAGDAFYKTDLAPWSRYLTGKEGKPPKDFTDPLKWMIAATHERGMEFHAWLNPYRATFDLDTTSLSNKHDFYKHPEWMVKYGKKYYYNPGLPEVRQKFSNIITEIVSNYNIDAIHFDDYFYPYRIKDEVFNDSNAFKKFGLPNQSLGDWRRSNVDSLVKNVNHAIKNNKPWVQFGISPFGIWKNKSEDPRGSDTKALQTTYEDLFADPLVWMENKWIDYIVPQAYWSMDYKAASHRAVGNWWAENVENSHLYMGNGTYKVRNNKDKSWNKTNEIPKQLEFSREQPNIEGNVFFSAKSLIGKNEKLSKTLRKQFYRFPSLNPKVIVKKRRSIQPFSIDKARVENQTVEIKLSHRDSIPRFANIYLMPNSKNKILVEKSYFSETEISKTISFNLPKRIIKRGLAVQIVDAYGNETQLQKLNIIY